MMMTNNTNRQRLLLLSGLIFSIHAYAEVTLDGTVGPAGSIAGPNYAITDASGTVVGTNLFHSFSTFNIGTGEIATFSGPGSISNIISRVTGGSASMIDGTLRSTIAGANLFLINPAGIAFGANASLDITGSFHVSTADYLTLGSDGRVDTTAPASSVLTTSAPSAFGFLDSSVGSISFQGGKLQVNTGETLSVVGGDITQQDTVLKAVDGRINMASLASAGEVRIDDNSFSTDQFSTLGTISISDTDHSAADADYNSNVHVSGTGGGTIHIRGEQLVMDFGRIFADTLGAGTGEQINIQIRDQMTLQNESKISTDTLGLGTSGDINVQAGALILEEGSRIKSEQWAVGAQDSGNVTVTATESITISGKSNGSLPGQTNNQESGVYAVTIGDGNTGSIQITSPEVTIEQDGHIQAMTTDDGNAGTITMNVTNLTLSTGGQVDSVTRGAGNAGKVDIEASGDVVITGSGDGSSGLYANTFSTGDGGIVEVDAASMTIMNDGKVQAFVGIDTDNPSPSAPTSATSAGAITINVTDLTIQSGAQILAQTTGDGQAGNISINTSGNITISSSSADSQSSGIYSTSTGNGNGGIVTISSGGISMSGGAVNVSSNSTGNAGSISASTSNLTMTHGAQFSTSTGGAGNSGDLNIAASGNVSISGMDDSNFKTGLYSLVTDSGNGGNIDVSGNNIVLSNNGTINSESTGTGNAGNITATAIESFQMSNSTVTTEALLSDGGNIKINADTLVYLSNSSITAAVGSGLGNGGNINIDPIFVVLDSSQILANAFGGNGGNITIVTDQYIASPDSILDASSALGIDGTVNIESPDVDMNSGITQLPDNFLDASRMIRQRCGAQNMANRSSFLVSGRNAIPVAPDSSMPLSGSFTSMMTELSPLPSYSLSEIEAQYASSQKNNLRPIIGTECTAPI